jgi:hypothetical protein
VRQVQAPLTAEAFVLLATCVQSGSQDISFGFQTYRDAHEQVPVEDKPEVVEFEIIVQFRRQPVLVLAHE